MDRHRYLIILIGGSVLVLIAALVGGLSPLTSEANTFVGNALQTTPTTPGIRLYLPFIVRRYPLHFPLNYSPYRPGQAPGVATSSSAEIEQDMTIFERETDLIRT